MRKFKFFALAFAALSFAACSDDAIEGQSGSGGSAGEGTPAYLTISFSANTGNSSRSTADDANNTGDDHSTDDPATGEDSGHHSDGITGESTIKNILVVVAPTSTGSNTEGVVKLYTPLDQSVVDEDLSDNFTETAQNSGIYKNAEPIEIKTGDYNVLVVVNPVAAISNETALAKNARTLYNDIVNGHYDYIPANGTNNDANDTYTDAANSIGMGVGYTGTPAGLVSTATGFMMANRSEASVKLNSSHTPDNPATVTIDVERVLSKITFRGKAADQAAGTGENVYEVNVNIGSSPAIIMQGAVAKEGQDGQYEIKTLNEAKDLIGQVVYGEYDSSKKLLGVYKIVYKEDGETPETVKVEVDEVESDYTLVTKLTAITRADYDDLEENKEDYYVVVDTDAPEIDLQYNTNAPSETKKWYVKLEGYALVNLSKTVNYVRHMIAGNSASPFGTLDGTNFLWTPNWDNNNNIVFVPDANGDMQFPEGTTTNSWFYNTLADVSTESAALKITNAGTENATFSVDNGTVKYYKTMKSLLDDGSTVTGSDHYESAPTLPAVGKLMSYCFENSTDIEHQTHGLSTGISFVATIWNNPGCTEEIGALYLYDGHNFTSIDQIKQTYTTNQSIQKLTEKSTREELAAVGIKVYNSNICYYYTTEIKHFDNGNPLVLGNMEFAIMRNNIYSLSVTGIKTIGDPFVDPTPGTENESTEAALVVQARIIPWIVRYNDIEFD